MGRESGLKDLRKQLRAVTNENMPEILKSETIVAAAKESAMIINARLDQIAVATEAEVKKLTDQQQAFRKYAMRELGMQLSEELGNISGTMLAWQAVLTKRLGITDMEGFDAEVQTEKQEILNRLQAEAQLKADQDAADAKAAALKAKEDAKALEADKAVQAALQSTDTAQT